MNMSLALQPELKSNLVSVFGRQQTAREDLAPISQRILDAFPSGSYALSALLRLMDIVESTSVPTAAVECQLQPRLLVNPEFVAKHAASSEKLLMLVMHELHHVLLGHTTLFPRVTEVQNFVFDAVINGIVCRMFPAKGHIVFFTDFYDSNTFPICLLRPPPGWPGRKLTAGGVAALPEAQRKLVNEVHQALYSPTGASYLEVFEALPKLLEVGNISGIPLLGGHGREGFADGALEHRAPILFDIVRGLVEQWPQPPDPIRGRSLADVLKDSVVVAKPIPSNRALLRGLIRKVAGLHQYGSVRRQQMDTMDAPTPIPSLDRRSLVMRALGAQPLLHNGRTPWRHLARSGERVHVYLDVSGSMDSIKGALYGAVLDCQAFVCPTVHLFSTKVASITLTDLRQGVCKTTGGTDIACVAQHMADNRIRRALVVTDGWVGHPTGQHHKTLSVAKLAVAYIGHNPNQTDLKDVANHTTTLSIGV
jgi:hypothetical protein